MKNIIVFLTLVTILGFLSFTTYKQNINVSILQKRFDFSGTNGLYIEYVKGLKFHWITNVADSGYYELRKADNTIISQGKTSSGRAHSVSVDHNIKDDLIFKFGGINETRYEIKLHPKTNLQDAIFKNVDSLYVVGDVHGRYNEVTNLLKKSQLIDNNLNWIGGKSHLVFLGDLFDRGDDVTKVLWFIYELEEKAKLEGGKVHLVLGNHEIMVMSKDLRYLSRKEAFITIAHKTTYDYMFHPSNSLLGEWLSKKPSVIKIDNAIFAHGGIVDLGTNSIDNFNKMTASYMQKESFLDLMKEHPDSLKYSTTEWNQIRSHFLYEDGPLWYRGYVYYDTLAPQLNAMLRKYNAKVHVVAHTTVETITQKYNGKLLTTDLNEAATELLLLVRNKKKYDRFKIDSFGLISELD